MDPILCLYTRYFWSERKLILVYAKTEKLFESMHRYLRLNAMSICHYSEKQRTAFDELIVSASLSAASQVERDYWGWTLRLPFANWGLFCAVDPEGMVCAKISPLAREAADVLGKVAVQRQIAEAPLRQSMLIPDSESALLTVEQYYRESEQLPARIAMKDGEALMILSMPEGDWEGLETASQAELLAAFHEANEGGSLQKSYEYVFYYDCRCDVKQMHGVVSSLPEAEQDYLWGDEGELHIECPRCGKRYNLMRDEIDS